MTPIKNKVYVTIKADNNDADYIEKVTEIDIKEPELFVEVFINFFNVMKKLVRDYSSNGWYHIDWYFKNLNDEDISHLMKFESFAYENQQEYYKLFEINKFSLLDGECSHDSPIVDMFPYFEGCWDFDNDKHDRIKGFHSLESISAIYIDSNGTAFNL